MNRYLSLACSLVAFFYLSSCESYSEPTEKAHQSDQPIVLTSFYPKAVSYTHLTLPTICSV